MKLIVRNNSVMIAGCENRRPEYLTTAWGMSAQNRSEIEPTPPIHNPDELARCHRQSNLMPHTIILGAGIIGAATAYYLTHPSHPNNHITILDPCPPASGASGKSGGFIARDWAGTATSGLAELSFRLHSELAELHHGNERWGYRRCRAVGVIGRGAGKDPMGDLTRTVDLRNVKKTQTADDLDWIHPGVIQSQNKLGDENSIAQWY